MNSPKNMVVAMSTKLASSVSRESMPTGKAIARNMIAAEKVYSIQRNGQIL